MMLEKIVFEQYKIGMSLKLPAALFYIATTDAAIRISLPINTQGSKKDKIDLDIEYFQQVEGEEEGAYFKDLIEMDGNYNIKYATRQLLKQGQNIPVKANQAFTGTFYVGEEQQENPNFAMKADQDVLDERVRESRELVEEIKAHIQRRYQKSLESMDRIKHIVLREFFENQVPGIGYVYEEKFEVDGGSIIPEYDFTVAAKTDKFLLEFRYSEKDRASNDNTLLRIRRGTYGYNIRFDENLEINEVIQVAHSVGGEYRPYAKGENPMLFTYIEHIWQEVKETFRIDDRIERRRELNDDDLNRALAVSEYMVNKVEFPLIKVESETS
jgi:RNA polymerase-binding transcription factor DksA